MKRNDQGQSPLFFTIFQRTPSNFWVKSREDQVDEIWTSFFWKQSKRIGNQKNRKYKGGGMGGDGLFFVCLVFFASKLNFKLKLTFSNNQVKITSSNFLFQIHCKKKSNYFWSFSDRLARSKSYFAKISENKVYSVSLHLLCVTGEQRGEEIRGGVWKGFIWMVSFSYRISLHRLCS